MTKIAIDRDSSYAPCSYLICRLDANGEWSTRDDDNTVLVQTDWDFPGVAQTFGWSLRQVQRENRTEPCTHDSTDGTVTCSECGLTATDFITAASEWLDDNLETVVDDPGYFPS